LYADAKIGLECRVDIDDMICFVYEMERFERLHGSIPDSEPIMFEVSGTRGGGSRTSAIRAWGETT